MVGIKYRDFMHRPLIVKPGVKSGSGGRRFHIQSRDGSEISPISNGWNVKDPTIVDEWPVSRRGEDWAQSLVTSLNSEWDLDAVTRFFYQRNQNLIVPTTPQSSSPLALAQ